MLLAEELFLLIMDDKTGKISTSAAGTINLGFAGAMLLDLGFREAITCKDKIIHVNENAIIDDSILEDIIDEIKKKDPMDVTSWIKHLSNDFNDYRIEIFKRFETGGVLDRVIAKKMEIFHSILHPILVPELKNNLFKAIENVVLGKKEPDERIIGILTLIKSCNLIKSIFQKEYWADISGKINDFIKSDYVTENLRAFLLEAHQAIIGSLYSVK